MTAEPQRKRWVAALLSLVGCGPKFVDTVTPAGVPNLVEFAPGLWRMGQPPSGAAWRELAARIAPSGQPALVVKLNDEKEGDDRLAEMLLSWRVVRIPLPPEDDKPWTVFLKPNPYDVRRAVQTIVAAHRQGLVVAWHCVHGRDRTSLISALVGMRLLGWSKAHAWADMVHHGFRWELPDLDAYWIEDVR
jgi:hypothetical protein